MISLLLISGALLLFIPYTLLVMEFDYPDILRQPAGEILTQFHQRGSGLILIWWLFAIVGAPLLGAIILMGQQLESKLPSVRIATHVGVIAILVQMIGLLRWTFVVPVLAAQYTSPDANESTKAAVEVVFQAIHQYGGVVIGEHVGQLFSIAWTLLVSYAFHKLQLFPRIISWLGYVASGIYLFAQGELFATVIPGFPVWDAAGFLGSTLWLLWLIVVGIAYWRKQPNGQLIAA